LSWRRFVGLGLQDKGPDETTRVRFRARMVEPGRHEKRLARVNRPLEKQGRLLKTCTLGDATWLPAARRAPGKQDKNGGAGEAGDTVKGGVPHSGDKAQVAGDQKHTLIRPTPLTAAPVQDRREFEAVVRGDEERVVADKAY